VLLNLTKDPAQKKVSALKSPRRYRYTIVTIKLSRAREENINPQ